MKKKIYVQPECLELGSMVDFTQGMAAEGTRNDGIYEEDPIFGYKS